MHIHDTILIGAQSSSLRYELRKILETNFNILEAANDAQLKLLLSQNSSVIAAVLVDTKMMVDSGVSTLESLYLDKYTENFPIIAILQNKSLRVEKNAIDFGAFEVVDYPFNQHIVKNRINNIVSFFYNKRNLQNIVNEQAGAIHKSYEVMVDTLSSLIEHRSIESGQHVLRIRRFTKILLEEMQRACPEYSLTKEIIQAITSASALHDIGKISIPDAILNKPGKLTDEEFEVMKTHTVTGSSILENFKDAATEDYLRYAYNICRYHHERWDGSGYPDGLSGDNIPICAQVVGLVDAYDALTNDRVYKKAIPYLEASNMIINGECGVFSPKLIECFKHVRGIFEELARSYADGVSPKSDAISVPLPLPRKATSESLEVVITKYHTLLHHFNVAAMEVDVESGIYHLLYDPNLDFASIRNANTFSEALRELAEKSVHPDDRHLLTEHLDSYIDEFFSSGLRKSSRKYRILCADGIYRYYEATIIRINSSEKASDKKVIALWKRLEKDSDTVSEDNAVSELYIRQSLIFDDNLSFGEISPELLKILGYSEDEIISTHNNSFVSLMNSRDKEDFISQLHSQLEISRFVEISVSLQRKNYELSHFLFKAKLCDDAEGHEYLRGILCNFDTVRNQHETSVSELFLYQTISEMSQDILFEWDLSTDKLVCSEKWKERFGYDNITEGAGESIPKSSHIHPDDVDSFIHKMKELKGNGSGYIEVALRFADNDGRYLWSKIRATAIRDEDGRAIKIIGLISDIDKDFRKSQLILDKAERDSLTKMLNKEAGRKRIEYYLSQDKGEKGGTLMVFDLDNFKEVNDRFGHMFGDSVLTSISQEIMGMFRESDIISRIGGDEFLVFMPEMVSKDIIVERFSEIISVVEAMYSDKISALNLSCSIGVSMSPYHGLSYQDLFLKADTALYVAKGRGKGCGVIYSEDMERPDYATSNISNHIDSDERLGIADNSLIEYVFQRLYDTSNIEATVNSVLEIIGKQMNVSRVYIFENNSDNTTCSNTFEWCNEGVNSEKDNLQNISYETDIPNYEENFNERGVFYCSDVSTLSPNLRDILEPQGVRALLHCAIRNGGKFSGYVGMDECKSTRFWTKEQINQLTFLSQLVSVFILKKREQERTEILNKDLEKILESQYAWVYVVDPSNYKLQFLNGRVSEVAPDAKIGAHCYKALMGYNEPCDVCPIKLNEGSGGSCKIVNKYLDLKVNATATKIHWRGKEQWLLTCRKIKDNERL